MKFFIIEKKGQDTSGVSVMQKIVAQPMATLTFILSLSKGEG